ncbi:PcfJ domain-containing protein [Endozoicomonas sp. ALB115]|uniref:PcfJ domain-containing protein n=1 Tax=Endozoicomonas sp. ALB115 TaxID=3403074 RepID=UPI003BB80D5C
MLTPEDLANEGKQMKHCVASYTRRVQEGQYFVYHMHSPQPLTIGVNIRNGVITGHDQIKGVRNHTPEKGAYDIVMSWLRRVLNDRASWEPGLKVPLALLTAGSNTFSTWTIT